MRSPTAARGARSESRDAASCWLGRCRCVDRTVPAPDHAAETRRQWPVRALRQAGGKGGGQLVGARAGDLQLRQQHVEPALAEQAQSLGQRQARGQLGGGRGLGGGQAGGEGGGEADHDGGMDSKMHTAGLPAFGFRLSPLVL